MYVCVYVQLMVFICLIMYCIHETTLYPWTLLQEYVGTEQSKNVIFYLARKGSFLVLTCSTCNCFQFGQLCCPDDQAWFVRCSLVMVMYATTPCILLMSVLGVKLASHTRLLPPVGTPVGSHSYRTVQPTHLVFHREICGWFRYCMPKSDSNEP